MNNRARLLQIRFSGLKNILSFIFSLLRWRHHDVIMAVGGKDEKHRYFRVRKINLREITMKYDSLVVFLPLDPASLV